MKLIIVGASGYIGKRLYRKSKKLFVTYGTSSSGNGELLLLKLDEPNNFKYEVIKPLDIVCLTAAISAPDICSNDHDRAWAVNVTGTIEFINQVIHRGGRIIFFSSDTVYGERKDEFDERAICNPIGEYALMKHEVEKQFLNEPLFKIIRLSYIFSQEDKFTKYLMGCVKRKEEADIFHPFYRSVIHLDDVVDGVIALSERWDEFPQNIFNFAGPRLLARIDFAMALQKSALPDLCFHVSEPDDDFFENRPKIINMKSSILEVLLNRLRHTLHEAIVMEFNTGGIIKND